MSQTDVCGAIVARLRTFASITALVGNNVASKRLDAWNLPSYAILVEGPRGGPGELELGLVEERLDITCYAEDERRAKILADRVMFALVGRDRSTPTSFILAHTRVYSVRSEGGRLALVDPDRAWPYVTCPVLVKYGGIPVD